MGIGRLVAPGKTRDNQICFFAYSIHTESKEFVHANFGWGGQKDGYYTFNAFYTDRGPVSPQSIEDRDYDHDFSAVTYNLSK